MNFHLDQSILTLTTYSGFVYVLLCSNETYYVGYSTKLHDRLRKHFSGQGAVFTKRNKPISVLSFESNVPKYRELEVWKFYSSVFGESRVGGFNSKYLS